MTTNPYQSSDAAASPPVAQAFAQTPPAWRILRSALGILAGLVAGGLVVFLIEIPGMFLHPPPPGVGMNDTEVLKAHFAKAPFFALLGVGIAWTVGPLVGSFVAAAIARWAYFIHGMIIAGIFVTADVINIRSLPHPAWLAVVGVLAPWVSGWIGAAVAHWLFSSQTPDPRPDPKPYDMRRKNMAC